MALVLSLVFLCTGLYGLTGRKGPAFLLLGLLAFSLAWTGHDGLACDEDYKDELSENQTALKASSHIDKNLNYVNENTKIKGLVIDIDGENKKMLLKLKTRGLRSAKLLVSSFKAIKGGDSLVGRQVLVSGKLEKASPARNPACFNYKFYLKRKGCSHVLRLRQVELVQGQAHGLSFRAWVHRTKLEFYKSLTNQIGKRGAGLIVAMVYGQKDWMEDGDYQAFQRNGLAHVLATSGLHIGILYALLVFFIGAPIRLSRIGLIFLLLLAYASLVGFTPSISRALIMIAIHMPARSLARRYDLESALAISGLIILILRPLDLFDIGFQLSFLCVLSLCRIERIVRNRPDPNWVKRTVYPIFGIQIIMVPMTAYLFNYFSAAGFLANLTLVFLAVILLEFSLVSASFMLFTSLNPGLIGQAAGLLADWFLKINQLIYAEGNFSWDVTSPPKAFLVFWYIGLVVFSADEFRIMFTRRKWKTVIKSLIYCCGLGLILISLLPATFKDADIVFWDVGQGNAVMFRAPSGQVVLVDGGGSHNTDIGNKVLKPALLKNGVGHIDLAIVTHLDTDHFDAVAALARQGLVGRMLVCQPHHRDQKAIMARTGLERGRLGFCSRGDRLQVGRDCRLDFLWPKPASDMAELPEDENALSLVFTATIKGHKLLITGDISQKEEEEILELGSALDSGLVQVPHHGSKYSSCLDFCKGASAEIAVVPVGRNLFGHPSAEAIENWSQAGAKIFRNDRDGALGIYLGEKIRVRRTIK